MQFRTSDIHLAEDFARKLSEACVRMLEGIPVSQALLDSGVSVSTFTTLVKGLRRSVDVKLPTSDDLELLRHPSWQDDLIYDLCGERYAYVPRDFDETLARIEDEELNQTEKEIIDSFYRRHQSIAEISQKLGIDDSNVRVKKNQALMKLRDRESDLVLGEEYLSRLAEMRQQYHQHEDELTWMIDTVVSLVVGLLCGGSGIALIANGLPGIAAGVVISLLVLVLGRKQMQKVMVNMKIPSGVRKMLPKSYFENRLERMSLEIKLGMYDQLENVKNEEISGKLVREISDEIETCLTRMAEVVEIPLGESVLRD